MKDSLALNKIAAAIIGAALIAMIVGFVGKSLYQPASNVVLEKPGYEILIATDAKPQMDEKQADSPEAVGPEAVSPLLASADLAKGEKLTSKCSACHSFNAGGATKVGPNLYDIINADMARDSDYAYSSALAAMGEKWTYENLNLFLASPKTYIAGTKMNYGGLKKVNDRANLIIYMRDLSDNPAPLP